MASPNLPVPGTRTRGRGAAGNPPNRFEMLGYERDPEHPETEIAPATQVLRDTSRTVISRNDSPDIPFNVSLNPYRGCEHGCVYCYARPTHEFLGFSAGLDFETRLLVKDRAPELLSAALASPKWNPQVLAMSGVTDPYQPVERRLEITRRCLEVLAKFRNPVGVITKSHLVTRDIDLLHELHRYRGAAVHISITTLDSELANVLEPRAASPARRLDAISRLRDAGIPVGVMVAPVLPGLTDHEVPSIIDAAAEAGAMDAGWIMLRLPHGVKTLFEDWLQRHRPDRAQKVLNRIRHLRGGGLDDARFGSRMRGEGVFAREAEALFRLARRRAGLAERGPRLSAERFRRPGPSQLSLFEPTE